jgi:hypothetical protein
MQICNAWMTEVKIHFHCMYLEYSYEIWGFVFAVLESHMNLQKQISYLKL